jgi:hypothetical protein
MYGVALASSGTELATVASCSIITSGVAAPTVSVPLCRRMPRSSSIDQTSIRWGNEASRNAIIGTRLWPPAMTLASSPCSASRATASAAVPAAW